jgi:cytochrome P450
MNISASNLKDLIGFDPLCPTFQADPYAHYRQLRANGAVHQAPSGLWLAPSYQACTDILRDPRFGHQFPDGLPHLWRGSTAPERRRTRSFLHLDPPEHTRLRRLVSAAFTPRFVERWRPRVNSLAVDLLDGLGQEADLLADFANPLLSSVISEILGVPPADRELIRTWSDPLARGLDPDFLMSDEEIAQRDLARAEFSHYIRWLADRRRAQPRDDLLSVLNTIEELSKDELTATVVLLLVAGLETTGSLIVNGTLALLRDPAQQEWFRTHLEHAPAVIEELLRYDSPTQFVPRIALADAEIAGARIKRGSLIMLLLGAANHDPEIFTDPDTLDVCRFVTKRAERSTDASGQRHVAFGLGIHFCLGAPLARLEADIALSRLAQLDLNANGTVNYKPSLVMRSLAELPVVINSSAIGGRHARSGSEILPSERGRG